MQAGFEHGMVAACGRYLRARLLTLNEYCAICDEPHVFGAMLQPTVCQRPLCAHQFGAFGDRIVGAKSLATHAEVLGVPIATLLHPHNLILHPPLPHARCSTC